MAFISFSGNTGSDPEVSYTPSGQALAKFSVAETERIRDRETGTWSDGDTTWWRCTAWGKVAEQVGEYVLKGTPVNVTGRVKIRPWEKDGEKQYSTEVTVDTIGHDIARMKPRGEARSGGFEDRPPF